LLLIDQLSAFCFLVKALLFFWTSLLIILRSVLLAFFYVFSHWSIFCDVWDGLCSLVVVLCLQTWLLIGQFSAAHK
jgi:hypothetical protein